MCAKCNWIRQQEAIHGFPWPSMIFSDFPLFSMIFHDISWSFMIVYMANIQIVNMIGGSCKHIMFTWNMIPLYRISFTWI